MKREQRMAEIGTIYEESHKIYGAPKIAAKMRQKGDRVSERTVGKYMKEIGIRACYRKQISMASLQKADRTEACFLQGSRSHNNK
ncbi:IS3 family transposase [Parablautia muri]